MALACIVLHNICIQYNEPFPPKLDLTVDQATNERRDRDTVWKFLDMHECAILKTRVHKQITLHYGIEKTGFPNLCIKFDYILCDAFDSVAFNTTQHEALNKIQFIRRISIE